MKKTLAVAGSVLALGLLVGCEDKQAEAQQNANIEGLKSEVNRMRSDIESLQADNMQLKSKINLVTDWLRKKVEEEKAKAAAKATADAKTAPKTDAKTDAKAGAKTGTTTGAKTADPKKKMFP